MIKKKRKSRNESFFRKDFCKKEFSVTLRNLLVTGKELALEVLPDFIFIALFLYSSIFKLLTLIEI